jgi:hypothetical protein
VEQWFSRTVNVAHKEDDALFQRALQNSKSKKAGMESNDNVRK